MKYKKPKSIILLKITMATAILSIMPFGSGPAHGSPRSEVQRSMDLEASAEPIRFGFVSIGRQIIVDLLSDDATVRKNGIRGDFKRTFNLVIDECNTIECCQTIDLLQVKPSQQLQFKLSGCLADNEPVFLDGILVEGSFSLKNEDGKIFQEGKDFSIADKGTLLKINPHGDAAKEGKLLALYKCWLSRIDTIVMDSNYALRVIKGDGYKSAPEVSAFSDDKIPIANVFVAGGEAEINSDNIWQIRNKRRTTSISPSCRPSFAEFRQRLESGDKIKIGFLGDSVTGGCSARKKTCAFPQIVESQLKSKFPKATIEVATLALGGGKCGNAVPLLPAFLSTNKPDVLFVEFVNDLASDLETFATPYQQLIAICREQQVKLCLVSPHYPIPLLAKARTWSTIKNNPYFSFLRMLTQNGDVELIDVSARWQHLDDEGLRPAVLLVNRLNHPNNTGHRMYAAELLKCFGIADEPSNSASTAK